MKIKFNKYLLYSVLIVAAWSFGIRASFANSDLFPHQQSAPALTSYVSGGVFKHTYYISPTGNDSTGDGSISKPWQSVNGANTGGTGVPVVAGDRIYFRGGAYPTHLSVAWKTAYNNFTRSGTSTDYIVFTNYPGETPQFSGGEKMFSFSIQGNYIVLNGLTFVTGGNVEFQKANHNVIQNSTFGVCGDGWGDQVDASCVELGDNVDSIVIRNNYFTSSSTSHAMKLYTSSSIGSNMKVLYNRFYGISTSYGVISQKGVTQNWEIAYNRFENCNIGISYGANYSYGTHSGNSIHHNVFDNVGKIISRSPDAGELRNFQVYDNVAVNSTSSQSAFLYFRCDGTSCMNGGTNPIGEFYNNVIFDIADAIDPSATTSFVNYPSYWNFNAYHSTAIRDSAENRNNLGPSNWQGSAVITSDTIQSTGNAGDKLYYISDTSPLRNKGRNGDTIGGFTWGTDPVRAMPPLLQ